MWLLEGLLAGCIAGILMGIATEIGYRLNLLKSNLVIVDGSFALRLMKRVESGSTVYFFGVTIHLITSAVFGIFYVILAKVIDFDTRLIMAIAIYVLLLWIAMLLIALPVAGQGMMGKKISGRVWFEQLLLHIIFGISFWFAFTIV